MADRDTSHKSNETEEEKGTDQTKQPALGSGDPDTPDNGEGSVEEELEIARQHADPSKGDKVVDGGDHVSTNEGGNPQE